MGVRTRSNRMGSTATAARHRRRAGAGLGLGCTLLLLPLLLAPRQGAQGFLLPAATPTHLPQWSSTRPHGPAPLRSMPPNADAASASGPTTPQQPPPPPQYRSPALLKRFARLPFWPIWHGLLIMLLDQVGLKRWSEDLEAAIGGRVSPMIYLPGTRACVGGGRSI